MWATNPSFSGTSVGAQIDGFGIRCLRERPLFSVRFWSHPPGSNRRPADYESAALPTELGWLNFSHYNLSPGKRSGARSAILSSYTEARRLIVRIMHELPEVETVVRSIAPHVTGKAIQHAVLNSRRVTRGGLAETAKALVNRTIQRLERRGKQMFFHLDQGVLYVHLGMTGKLLWNGERTPYTRAELVLSDGLLLYDDIRQFGRVEYYGALPELFQKTGPDALSVGFPEFYARLKQHRTPIKALLLNQAFISGVGNIYADEALFASRLHPRVRASRISKTRAEQL